MDSSKLSKLHKAAIDLQIETLASPKIFNHAANDPADEKKISFNRTVTVETQLHIRHGSALVLRQLRWLVTDQVLGEPLLVSPVIEALGLDCHNFLASAADIHGGVVDIPTLLFNQAEHSNGRIGRILNGVFHADGGDDDADLHENNGLIYLGPENPKEKEIVLQQKLKDAKENGLSSEGCKELEKLLREFRDVIKIKLDAGQPADIEQLIIQLKADAFPVRAKQRRYPQPKREVLVKYVEQLWKLVFASPELVSSPLFVPKRPPAMYRLTIDYRPVNSATRATFWPMPNIEAELADHRGSTAFEGINTEADTGSPTSSR